MRGGRDTLAAAAALWGKKNKNGGRGSTGYKTKPNVWLTPQEGESPCAQYSCVLPCCLCPSEQRGPNQIKRKTGEAEDWSGVHCASSGDMALRQEGGLHSPLPPLLLLLSVCSPAPYPFLSVAFLCRSWFFQTYPTAPPQRYTSSSSWRVIVDVTWARLRQSASSWRRARSGAGTKPDRSSEASTSTASSACRARRCLSNSAGVRREYREQKGGMKAATRTTTRHFGNQTDARADGRVLDPFRRILGWLRAYTREREGDHDENSLCTKYAAKWHAARRAYHFPD